MDKPQKHCQYQVVSITQTDGLKLNALSGRKNRRVQLTGAIDTCLTGLNTSVFRHLTAAQNFELINKTKHKFFESTRLRYKGYFQALVAANK